MQLAAVSQQESVSHVKPSNHSASEVAHSNDCYCFASCKATNTVPHSAVHTNATPNACFELSAPKHKSTALTRNYSARRAALVAEPAATALPVATAISASCAASSRVSSVAMPVKVNQSQAM